MQCARCGATLKPGDAFCTDCGVPVPSPKLQPQARLVTDASRAGHGSFAEAIRQPVNILRAVCGLIVLAGLILGYHAQNGTFWVVLLGPVLVGLLFPLLQLRSWTNRVEAWEALLMKRRERARAADGKFARFFRRPFYACAGGIWRVSQRVGNPHVRAGMRVALSLYLVAISSFFLITAAYVIMAVVVMFLTLALIGWILSLSGSSGKRPRRTTARKERDWFGNEKIVYTDETGSRVGTSREAVGIFGDRRTEHFDAVGKKTHETRQETGVFGEQMTVQYGQDGRAAGFAREEADLLGNQKLVYYDNEGRKTAESQETKDVFGNDVTERVDHPTKPTAES